MAPSSQTYRTAARRAPMRPARRGALSSFLDPEGIGADFLSLTVRLKFDAGLVAIGPRLYPEHERFDVRCRIAGREQAQLGGADGHRVRHHYPAGFVLTSQIGEAQVVADLLIFVIDELQPDAVAGSIRGCVGHELDARPRRGDRATARKQADGDDGNDDE